MEKEKEKLERWAREEEQERERIRRRRQIISMVLATESFIVSMLTLALAIAAFMRA